MAETQIAPSSFRITELPPLPDVADLPELRASERTALRRHLPRLVLGLILFAAFAVRIAWLSSPNSMLIFDEKYYVNAARIILGWRLAEGDPYWDQPIGLDPNREHPPLGKLMLTASMNTFGDNPLGWRLPSEIAGMSAIVLLYAIVRAVGGGRWLGVLAAGLFAADNLALVHSRIGTLDMPLLALMLLGAWCALRRWHLAAGAAFALAALVKIGGLYGLAAMLLYEACLALMVWRTTRSFAWSSLRPIGLMLLAFTPLWLDGLWLLDVHFSTYAAPWDHLRYILEYGFSLNRPNGPVNQESQPWQWLLNDVQMTYLRVDQQLKINGEVAETFATINFRGAMNPVIIGAAPLGMAFAVWRAWRLNDRLSLWVVAWCAATYLPFYPLGMIEHRISYIFYFLPTLPAVTVGLAQLLRRAGLPPLVLWSFLLAVLLGFAGYFPFRQLPPA